MATLESLQTKIKKLEQQAEALIAKQSSGVIEKIRDLMARHGLTTADVDAYVGGKKRVKKVGAKTVGKQSAAAAKYRDPKSGATWSGHGRAPGWIASAKNRDKFLVDGSTPAAAKPAPVGKSKAAGNYARGPQPALYRDPKSGATWSGRGRAPAWLATVKDRSKFLIAGAAEVAVAATAGTVSKSKAAAKKTSKAVGATGGKGQQRGPQPAKYRDPKSGATWSGRGPAPAWLSGAKDRTRFLIDGASVATGTGAARKPKAVAKKPATKTAVAKKVATKTNVGAAPEAVTPQATA